LLQRLIDLAALRLPSVGNPTGNTRRRNS
jgi:hypothetical protein